MSNGQDSGDTILDQKVQQWLKWDQNPVTLKEIQDLVAEEKTDELKKCLLDRLKFGTAGLRGPMRSGFSGMNDLVIIQTTQGLVNYMLTIMTEDELTTTGIIIGFDSRYNSKRFAQRTAVAFLSKNIPVYLFQDIVPTPFVPFGVSHLKLKAGIMITASHNPKMDNGYKLYFENGSQIIPPHDSLIQKSILANLEPWPNSWNLELVTAAIDPTAIVSEFYYKSILDRVFDPECIKRSNLAITYTSLHGVGHEFLTRALKSTGFENIHPVEEQMIPDPEFPTVTFPNPEEGQGVLDLSLKTGHQTGSTIILANDPDADRVAVAERSSETSSDTSSNSQCPENGSKTSSRSSGTSSESWRIFSGNEIGILLGWWTWFTFCERSRTRNEKINPADCYMMSSAVSSSFLSTLSSAEGFNFIETLTGFKWMGNLTFDLLAKSKKVLFAFEEAIGYMVGTQVLDKDGISAAIEIANMASYLRCHLDRSLSQQLTSLYQKYGYHFSLNSYFICHDQIIIKNIFQNISNPYPRQIGTFKVTRIRDLHSKGYDSRSKDHKPDLPTSSSSFMITLYFDEDNMKVTLRTSGTEPKVKYYSEVKCQVDQDQSQWPILEDKLRTLINLIVDQFLKPTQNGLIAKE